MKTIVRIELDDDQRNKLACMIAGKATAKMASRADVVALCERHIGGLIEECSTFDSDAQKADKVWSPGYTDLSAPDREDEALLRGKPPSYVYGWNKVKRGVA